jgi:excisionase family DNA binding protein
MKRRMEVITETDRIIIIKQHGGMLAWCSGCGREINMITPEQAAGLRGVTPRTIYRWVEAGKLHFIEPPDGSLFVCPNSL